MNFLLLNSYLIDKIEPFAKWITVGLFAMMVIALITLAIIDAVKNKKSRRKCLSPAAAWWRRGELNPRPKTHPRELLRAQTVIAEVLLFPFPSPQASRHANGSGELHDTWCAQSLAHACSPLVDA